MGEWQDYLSAHGHIKAFVKGPPGCGKTYLAMSITKIFRTLAIDVEGGVISAYPVVNPKNMTLRLIREPDSKNFFGRLSDVMAEAESGQYEAVVVDSFTEVTGRMEDEYSSASKSGRLEFGDWYVLIDRVKKFGRRLRDLNCHTIVTSLTKPTGKEDGTSIFEPILPGQSCAVVPSFFDTVGLIRMGSGKSGGYLLSSGGPSVYQVRDRTHTLNPDEPVDAKNPEKVWQKLVDGLKAMQAAG